MDIASLEERLLGLLGDNFRITTDEDGQIIIHTGLYDNDGELEEETIGLDDDMDDGLDLDDDIDGIGRIDDEW